MGKLIETLEHPWRIFFNQKRVNVCEHSVKIAPDGTIFTVCLYIHAPLINKDLREYVTLRKYVTVINFREFCNSDVL